MTEPSALTGKVTELLRRGSDPRAADELMPLVYDELRRLARGFFRSERKDHTLQPTALVHEVYLRLVDQSRVEWQGRQHFFAVAARMMRRLLVDSARTHGREKRGGEWQRVDFELIDRQLYSEGMQPADVIALDDAIERLAKLSDREARVVELRFFAGLDVGEVADALGVSRRTAEGDWTHARAWLRRELAPRS